MGGHGEVEAECGCSRAMLAPPLQADLVSVREETPSQVRLLISPPSTRPS